MFGKFRQGETRSPETDRDNEAVAQRLRAAPCLHRGSIGGAAYEAVCDRGESVVRHVEEEAGMTKQELIDVVAEATGLTKRLSLIHI